MASKPGGIVGLMIALIVVGALAGTPFYLGMLQSEPRALDAAVEEDVEAVRRVVLNLDEHLAAVSKMSEAPGNPEPLSAEELDRLTREEPDDVFGKQFVRDLDVTADLLRSIEKKDADRGTLMKVDVSERRKPRAKGIMGDFKNKYLKSHEKMLREAEAALGRLRNISRGASSATSHVGVNRIKGIYLLAKGRLQANEAQFERLQASLLLGAATESMPALLDLRRQETTLEVQSPKAQLAAVEERLKGTQAAIKAAQASLGRLDSVIKQRQEQLDELEQSAAQSQQELTALGAKRFAYSEFSSRYLALSEQNRKAEAEAAAIRNGTLRDAKIVESAEAEPTTPTYEGGTPEVGLEALTSLRDRGNEQVAELKKIQESLEKQRDHFAELENSLTTQHDGLTRTIEEQAGQVKDLLAQADAHEEKALKAEEEAIKTLKEASRAAKDAATAAKRISGDARQASGAGGAVDERLQRVSQDVDTEASLQCLAAEIAYSMALLRCEQIAAVRERTQAAGLLATATGEEAASAGDLDKIRTEAANFAADALKAYELAGNLIGKANVKSGSLSISGKNYLWQVQVGQAAVHLLLAAIQSDDMEKVTAEKTLAYNLLKEAAEKREQSPLLTPAIETVEYLQKTAH